MSITFDPSLIPYVELAEILDKIPNGFAYTEDGTHLKLLKKLFTIEEANITCKLTLGGKSINQIISVLSYSQEDLIQILEKMLKKGLIRAWTRKDGIRKYALFPFAVGIYEEQLDKMDPELAELTEEYFNKGKGKGLFDTEPAIFKVLPINKEIKTELEIFPYEDAENLITNAKSWGIRDCICKEQQEQLGNTCSYPKTVCINFASSENAFENSELTRAISKDEALGYLSKAEEAGLIHCTMNVKSQQFYICNCCTCCCGILRGLTKHSQPHAFIKSNYRAHVDEEECIGCEICVDRCQFDAISIHDDFAIINEDKCIGCGVCTISCTEDALHLFTIENTKKNEPPEDIQDWMTQKAISRNVDPSDIL